MSKGLSLDISIDKSKFSLERTYRDEGLSVGADHMVCISHCY